LQQLAPIAYQSMMVDEHRKIERVQLLMTTTEVAAIDDWLFKNRIIRGRSEAIRRLIALGLEADRAKAEPAAVEHPAQEPEPAADGLPKPDTTWMQPGAKRRKSPK
jgi:hypothetical protein